MKKCKKCGETKELFDFYKSKRYKDGHLNKCKKCESERSLNYYKENREDQMKKKRERYYTNHEENLRKKREYDELNREEVNRKAKERYHNNLEYAREYYKNNKEVILKRNKKWRLENPERFRELTRKSGNKFKDNNPHISAWRNILYRTLYSFDKEKNESTEKLMGYNADELRTHIESLFEEGMSWENHGEWHIDHVYPLSKFDKDTPISEVNSLDNLKPLWKEDNLRKGNRI